MELFQQYLVEKFPKDGRHSTSGIIHELDSTVNACWEALMALGKLPHIRKWLHETKLLVSIKSRSACLYSFYHSSWYKPFSYCSL